MIQINCNNCKALLQIDDAFAGGVCRCRYCGTIQTVPKHLKQSANGEQATVSASSNSGSGKAKTLYRKKNSGRGEALGGSGSGLDELANIVASSGLASQRLTKPAQQPEAPEGPRGIDRKTMMIVAGAGAIILVLLIVIIVMATGGNAGNAAGNNNNLGVNNLPGGVGPDPVVAGPAFLGQKLEFGSVVFVLDRGQGTLEEGRLEMMKEAVAKSLSNFGEERLFQVVFWELDGQVWSFPKDTLAPANKANLEELWKQIQNVTGRGQPKVEKAVKKAAASKPDAVVLIAVKPYLDEEFVQAVKRGLGSARPKVFTFSLWQENLKKELEQVAKQYGGEYRNVTVNELREAGGRQ
jgi:hypothetical protein